MRKWAFLFGLTAVYAALVMAAGQSLIADDAVRATASWAGGVFSIPLAAAIRL